MDAPTPRFLTTAKMFGGRSSGSIAQRETIIKERSPESSNCRNLIRADIEIDGNFVGSTHPQWAYELEYICLDRACLVRDELFWRPAVLRKNFVRLRKLS
jgi:hypothetical protein